MKLPRAFRFKSFKVGIFPVRSFTKAGYSSNQKVNPLPTTLYDGLHQELHDQDALFQHGNRKANQRKLERSKSELSKAFD